jgi:hypothetical protein
VSDVSWRPIELVGKIELVAESDQADGVYTYQARLSEAPDLTWLRSFHQRLSTLRPFVVEGETVRIRCQEGELWSYRDELRDRIAATNRFYQEAVIPQHEERAGPAGREQLDREGRRRRARQEIEELDD